MRVGPMKGPNLVLDGVRRPRFPVWVTRFGWRPAPTTVQPSRRGKILPGRSTLASSVTTFPNGRLVEEGRSGRTSLLSLMAVDSIQVLSFPGSDAARGEDAGPLTRATVKSCVRGSGGELIPITHWVRHYRGGSRDFARSNGKPRRIDDTIRGAGAQSFRPAGSKVHHCARARGVKEAMTGPGPAHRFAGEACIDAVCPFCLACSVAACGECLARSCAGGAVVATRSGRICCGKHGPRKIGNLDVLG